MEANVRLALVGEQCATRQQRFAMAAVARAFQDGATARGMATDVVLVVPAGSEDDVVFSEMSLPVRAFAWDVLDGQAADRALYYAGLAPTASVTTGPRCLAHVPHAVIDDGIRHLCDCDAWILAQATSPAAVLPLKPFLVIADDTLHHTSGGLSAETLRIVADNLTAAAGVLVWSEAMRDEVHDFYGVEAARVRVLPQLTAWRSCQEQRSVEPQLASEREPAGLEHGQVWFTAEASLAVGGLVATLCTSSQSSAWTDEDEQASLAYGEALAELL